MSVYTLILPYLGTLRGSNFTYPSILLVLFLVISFYKSKKRVIYLLDYACCKPPSSFRAPLEGCVEHAMIVFKDNLKAARFQIKILERAGLGEETCLPTAIHYLPPRPSLYYARDEVHLVVFSALDDLFAKSGLRPTDIGILITNCSIFCPNPSLSSMIVNKYKMRSSIKSYSLSGMGCSASPISVDLASKLLQVGSDSYAIVVSTEILTPNVYLGSERSMLVPSCLFRLGCSAILLTNKWTERKRAKYRLLHIIRTHKGSDDRAYNSVNQREDDEGKIGILLNKDLLIVAGETLKTNITTLGPLVLPISEKIRFVIWFIGRKYLGPYVPNFSKVFDHFCIHAGGRAVIDELQKGLRLSDHQVEASRMGLHRFGNTSSSSIWYELSYLEAKERMKKGDLIWQIAFGSGFKCNSVVLKCNRTIKVDVDGYGPWKDCISRYPVQVPDILNLVPDCLKVL